MLESATEAAHVLDRLERALLDRVAARTESPILDAIFQTIEHELAGSADYRGKVRDNLQQLIILTLRFLRDRHDTQRSTGGDRQTYLFEWKSSNREPPLEKALGIDYREFLVGSQLGRAVRAEVRDIAGGRVDVLLEFGTHHFVAELKRELHDASRASLRQYLGQAALYEGTDVHLGLLLVLDLTDKTYGVPSLRENAWVEIIPGTYPRYVVVFRIPGNRIDPSDTRTIPTTLPTPTHPSTVATSQKRKLKTKIPLPTDHSPKKTTARKRKPRAKK